jgi:tetratricopeptide (TPR) repeat protein
MRHPSRSGIELTGKILSVVYAEGHDDQICRNMAESFAKSLGEDYGEDYVQLYSVNGRTEDYMGRDSLVSLLMTTGSDVVFLFDSKVAGEITMAGLPVNVAIYCYDGMNRDDKVQNFSGQRVLAASSAQELQEEAVKAGKLVAEPFETQWKHEQYSIAYYDTAKWYEALVRADQYDWKGAMEIWMSLLDTKDMMKKAAAEYNISVACYMFGDFDLASEWLDRSDADNKLPTLSDALRKRIDARKR